MAIFRTTATCALVIFVLLSITTAGAKSPAPVPGPALSPGPASVEVDCMTLIYNMSDCLTYVEEGSNSTKPDKACCPELAGMLDSKPICLCKLLVKSSDFPVELDLSRALKLPSVCGLQIPPISVCQTVGPPSGSPTSSEGPSSSSSDEVPPTAGKNGGSREEGTTTVAYLLVLAVAYATLPFLRVEILAL